MTQKMKVRPITPEFDPWEAYMDVDQYGDIQLTNVEFTTTTLCNMRCEHCAVGYTLQPKDPNALPLSLLLKRLDEIPRLRSLSITAWRADAFVKIGKGICRSFVKICA